MRHAGKYKRGSGSGEEYYDGDDHNHRNARLLRSSNGLQRLVTLRAHEFAVRHGYLFVPVSEETAGMVGASSDLVHDRFLIMDAPTRQTIIFAPR